MKLPFPSPSRSLPPLPLSMVPLLLSLLLTAPLLSRAALTQSHDPLRDSFSDPLMRDPLSDSLTDPLTDSVAVRSSGASKGFRGSLSTAECEAFRVKLASSFQRTATSTGGGRDYKEGSGDAPWQAGEYRRRPGQCWSRAEWRCFAGMAPGTKPSKNLEKMLDMYQNRVRECRVLEPPKKLRERLLSGAPTACQYMLWGPTHDGLGNQILSLVSAFAYSLLTYRVLLIEPHNASISQLFCEPFPRLPTWKFAHVQDIGTEEGLTHEVKEGIYRTNRAFDLDRPPPAVLSFHVHLFSDMQPFLCPEFHRWAQGASALVTSSVVFWLPGLYYIPHFRTKLESLFPSRRAFATLLPLLLHPSNSVWGHTTEFLLTKGPFARNPRGPVPAPSYGSLRVGIQFRQKFEIELEDGVESAVQCYQKISKEFKKQQQVNFGPLWPQAPGAPYAPSSPETPEYFNGAVRKFVDFFGDSGGLSQYRPKDVTVYVASLNGSFSEGVMDGLGKAGVEAEAVILTERGNREQVLWDAQHNERALIEILQVALSSQVLIVTPRSTFGYTVVGFSSAPAYFMTPCERAMQEPCFLRPPNSVQCRYSRFEVEKGVIPGVSTPLLRPCPDALWLHQIGKYQLSDGIVIDNAALRV